MPETVLIHFIFPERASGERLMEIVADIQENQRLAAGGGWHGHGVYAYFADEVPANVAHAPGVEFEVESEMVTRVRRQPPFAFIRVPLSQPFLPIRVRRFVNLP